LAITAGALLFASIKNLVTVLVQRSLAGQAVAVLDQILLILLVIERTAGLLLREHLQFARAAQVGDGSVVLA